MADSATTPQERVRIFDRQGFPLAEFSARVERSWVIGGEGRASFSYPSRKTDIVNGRVLNFGNWLLVQNSALPAWVGVLDEPLDWDTREVDIKAYSPEHVFGQRRGPLEEKLTGSAGTIFEKILQHVNEPEQTILQPGNIWRGGPQREETVNPTPLDEDLRRLQERSLEEYQFTPVIFGGVLQVRVDWLAQLGIDTGFLLHEGKEGGNIKADKKLMVEDGPIYNEILGYGDGETWESKPTVTVRDQESIGKYGLRQYAKSFSGVTDVTTLTENANQLLLDNKQPKRRFRINALNIGDTFKYISLGNRFQLQLQNLGFTGGTLGFKTTIRILGMSYDSSEKNVIGLVVEEVL